MKIKAALMNNFQPTEIVFLATLSFAWIFDIIAKQDISMDKPQVISTLTRCVWYAVISCEVHAGARGLVAYTLTINIAEMCLPPSRHTYTQCNIVR